MKQNHILITGDAGFIGSNLTYRLLGEGHKLTILDNLSRSGCARVMALIPFNNF